MLFVDDDQTEVVELYIVFDNGVGANQNMYAAVLQTFLDGGTLLSLDVPCQQLDMNRHVT